MGFKVEGWARKVINTVDDLMPYYMFTLQPKFCLTQSLVPIAIRCCVHLR